MVYSMEKLIEKLSQSISCAIFGAFDEANFDSDGVMVTIEESPFDSPGVYTLVISKEYFTHKWKFDTGDVTSEYFGAKLRNEARVFIEKYKAYLGRKRAAELCEELNKNRKEKENMAIPYNNMGNMTPVKDEARIETEKKVELLEAERKTRLAEINAEYDKKLHDLWDEYDIQREKTGAEERARSWHVQYQALIDQGFSEEQAMKLTQDIML